MYLQTLRMLCAVRGIICPQVLDVFLSNLAPFVSFSCLVALPMIYGTKLNRSCDGRRIFVELKERVATKVLSWAVTEQWDRGEDSGKVEGPETGGSFWRQLVLFSWVVLDTSLPSLSLRTPSEGLLAMCRVWELVMELGGFSDGGWDRVRVRPLPTWPGLELLCFFSQGWPCSPRALGGLLTAGSSVTTTTPWTGTVAARPVWHVQEVRATSLLLGPLPESRDGLGRRGQESGGGSPELGLGCSVLRSLVHFTGIFWAIGF